MAAVAIQIGGDEAGLADQHIVELVQASGLSRPGITIDARQVVEGNRTQTLLAGAPPGAPLHLLQTHLAGVALGALVGKFGAKQLLRGRSPHGDRGQYMGGTGIATGEIARHAAQGACVLEGNPVTGIEYFAGDQTVGGQVAVFDGITEAVRRRTDAPLIGNRRSLRLNRSRAAIGQNPTVPSAYFETERGGAAGGLDSGEAVDLGTIDAARLEVLAGQQLQAHAIQA
ncbi:hypothetical protein R6U49_16575 [Pseudomonas aeruginosa]|nr:hypothetical protein [Pseudomonas aeruginosa]WRH55900.1 hypothetical protein R6U49_16575 [Pseudomonas aeruginosa]